MDDDSFDIDPEIAAAMGFGGFGTQSGRKRKFDDGAFVDSPSASANASTGKGANSIPLGTRTTERSTGPKKSNETPGLPRALGTGTDEEQLQALRHGVKNLNGDMVYFLPSFLEDPWYNLQLR
ncbi:Hypothetical protein R9X50_00161200 [Acrodontium crateriforme]|uniref:Uncharacterized protein n=1 Tax=Acrodontium crateriforme TaxID=150365 RepID=A0AAQ3R806_9PEZI|nr:Hypothetical protein R9X50_00161200 [Acrodontium crateriforme]